MLEFKIGSIASGMGMHLHGLKQMGGIPVWAIELDEAIAQCYRNNHQGQLHVKKVQDVEPADLADIDLLTVTLSCKNASTAKGANRGETAEDISAAEAVANIIRAKLPKYFMLENVWAYRSFQAFQVIQDALAECGYYFQIHKFNTKDWGIAQSRDRLYGLGVRGGSFPAPQVPQVPIVGWYEAIKDLIPQLPETELAPWQQKKFPGLATNALIKRVGGGRASDRLYQPDEPAFTIKALGRSSSNHWHQADVCIDGKFYALTPQSCLRLFGDKETADSIWLPPTKSLAMEVVGNGASWVMFRELFKHLRGEGMDLISNIQKFLSECDRPAQSAGEIAQALAADVNEVGEALRKGTEQGLFKNTDFGYWILRRDTGLPKTTDKQSTLPTQLEIMFNFPQTQGIAEQIAQMQEQLALLTSSLQPFKELEDTANDLLTQVSKHAQLMREKGVEERSLVNWASQIYSAIGVEFYQSEAESIKALQSENASLIAKINELNDQLSESQALESEAPDKEYDNPLSDIDARYRGDGFIQDIKNCTKSEIKAIGWTDIEDCCNGDIRVLRGMIVGAKVKAQKEFVESFPRLLANYILDTGDRSPLDWVGESLKSDALEILNQQEPAA
jgi:hypothetical protein